MVELPTIRFEEGVFWPNMDKKELEQQIIKNYQQDEQMMILIFSQWCINHDLDPKEVYLRAYPTQADNVALQQAIELTVPKSEAGDIADETLLNVLALYGNDDLAYVVTQEIEKNVAKKGMRKNMKRET